ncbi:hypothetical protein A2U01_0031373 [Trifolium medium]|uniref:Uncharacterized protein n=1 Tax=Trifolium medium TaxID=97028 RepID=A0A392PFM5_9FABA|nr:hypothetical protein [Trifolium medium]
MPSHRHIHVVDLPPLSTPPPTRRTHRQPLSTCRHADMANRRQSKEGAWYGGREAVLRCDELRQRRSSEVVGGDAVVVATGF